METQIIILTSVFGVILLYSITTMILCIARLQYKVRKLEERMDNHIHDNIVSRQLD